MSSVRTRVQGPDRAAATRFIEALRAALRAPEANAVFRPLLTGRQVHYFNLVNQYGGIAAGARSANVSSPTVSEQLRRLEATLEQTLFERTSAGARQTDAGSRIAPLMQDVEERMARIAQGAGHVAARTQSTVTIGLLPSSGHDSEMTANVARALTAVRRDFPGCRLRAVQHSDFDLHAAVRAGQVNLALVTMPQGPFPRVRLGPSEPLSGSRIRSWASSGTRRSRWPTLHGCR